MAILFSLGLAGAMFLFVMVAKNSLPVPARRGAPSYAGQRKTPSSFSIDCGY